MNNSLLIQDILVKINKIIDVRKINKTKLADEMKVSRNTLYNYLDGSNDMPIEVFIRLCDYFSIELKIDESTDGIDIAFENLKHEIKRYIDSKVS